MSELTRRAFICSSVAVVAVSSAPMRGLSAFAQAPKPLKVAWAVGTPGEWDWQVVYDVSADEARRTWVSETLGGDRCEIVEEMEVCGCEQWLADGNVLPGDDCDCDWCRAFDAADAERKTEWDNKNVTAGDGLWFAAGLGAFCSRCSYETSIDECGCVVADKPVCEACMTLADWLVVDPERAAELEADAGRAALASAQGGGDV